MEEPQEEVAGGEEFEIVEDGANDLETAMQEALEAVEKTTAVEEPEAVSGAAGTDVEQLRRELGESRDRSMRTLADFDNFRKRVERDRVEGRKYAGFDILQQILPIVDNLERALEASGSIDDLKLGVGMVARQLEEILKRSGVERIEAEGRPFDPRLHEAVSRHEEASVEVPTVTEELQGGYTMHDRLIRAATVRVAMPEEKAVEGADGDGGTD